MVVYIGVFVAIVLLCAILHRDRGEKPIFVAVVFGLFLFIGYRYWVGCDYYGYLHRFNLQQRLLDEGMILNKEFLFDTLVYVLALLGESYESLNIVAAAIFCCSVLYIGLRHGGGILLLLILFPLVIIQLQMSGLRQGLALSFLIVALSFAVRRKWLVSVLLILFASGFHTSAIMFLPFSMIRLRLPTAVKYVVIAVVVLPVAILYSGDSGVSLISKYLDSEIYSAGALFRVIYVFVSAGVIVFLIRYYDVVKSEDIPLVWLAIFYVAILVPLFFISSTAAHRLTFYAITVLAVLVCTSLQSKRVQRHIVAYFSAANLCYIAVWFGTSRHAEICYLPYDSILFLL